VPVSCSVSQTDGQPASMCVAETPGGVDLPTVHTLTFLKLFLASNLSDALEL
jgi:hypothetical protein